MESNTRGYEKRGQDCGDMLRRYAGRAGVMCEFVDRKFLLEGSQSLYRRVFPGNFPIFESDGLMIIFCWPKKFGVPM